MNSASASSISPTPDREIVSTRVFPAARERVFDAFAEPAALAQWWGPQGFTNTITTFELRPGGAWHVVMRAPDGTEYPNVSAFTEVTRPSRIVFQHEEPVHRFLMTMSFEAQGAGTLVTWCMRFETAEEVARIGRFLVDANQQNFDRLAAHLSSHL